MPSSELPYRERDPSEFHPFVPWQTAMSYLLSFSNILTIVSNGFVFYLIYRFKHLRSLQNMLIMALAVPDFMVGISKSIIQVPNALRQGWVVGDLGCQWNGYADVAFCCQSVFGALLLSGERYLAIVKKRYLTHREVKYMLGGICLLGFVLGTAPYWFGDKYVLQSSMLYCNGDWAGPTFGSQFMSWACVSIVCFTTFGSMALYILIFRVVRQNRLQWGTKGATTQQNKAQQRAEELEARIAKKFAVIVGVFCFNWMFYNFSFIYQTVTLTQISPAYDVIAVTTAYWNSFCNPIICLGLDERWLKAAKITFGMTVSEVDSEAGSGPQPS
ncbi:hypothetical protein BC832DRAFT_592430 [Gaertneriomyces semiglobifer]|nr:hypothetical protein BC832DRAFT_592430 [Gaertneriomyces semiglobifer]